MATSVTTKQIFKPSMIDKIVCELKKGTTGQVYSDVETLDNYATDFGRLAYKLPLAVAEATCEQDIIHCLRVSQEFGIPLKMRGSGHAFNGQALCENGLIICNSKEHGEVKILDNNLVEVTARTPWYQLEVELNNHGYTAPVLTDLLQLTIGGTLSVGGYGARSINYGTQVEQIERLRLILPNGDVVWCSHEENQHLFHYGLGTLGQLGIIERVVMRTMPFRQKCRTFSYLHPDLIDLAESMRWMEESSAPLPEFFHALLLDGIIVSKYGREYIDGVIERNRWHPQLVLPRLPMKTQVVDNYALWSNDVQVNWMRHYPSHKAMWGDFFFDYQGFHQFTEFVVEQLKTSASPYMWSVYAVATKKTERSHLFPFIPSSVTSPSRFVYSLGVYNLIPADDCKGIDIVRELQAQLLNECVRLGGLPYLYGTYQLDIPGMEVMYGEHYRQLKQIRQTLDPHNLVNPGVFPF